ncbi:hypothetical protein Hanom_Chr01g00011561 [Helianthus anomalus]
MNSNNCLGQLPAKRNPPNSYVFILVAGNMIGYQDSFYHPKLSTFILLFSPVYSASFLDLNIDINMSTNYVISSAASAYSYAQEKNDQDVQHSVIRATSRFDEEIKPTSTCMPCQHCANEKNEKKRRVPRERLCYYGHMPGHQIYTCKAKENDEEMQLIRQAINAEIRSQDDDVHCREEMIVIGTDGGKWNEIWYVNPTFNHHFVGNIDVFKR